MKKVLGLLIIVVIFGVVGMLDTHYSTDVTVVEATDETAVIQLWNGHEYKIGTTERLKLGSQYRAIIDTKGTDELYTDDEIITIY